MRATAPAGDADYSGVVAWSGELGYGVREPELGQRYAVPVPGPAGDPPPDETEDQS